jgi:hypothetical protein
MAIVAWLPFFGPVWLGLGGNLEIGKHMYLSPSAEKGADMTIMLGCCTSGCFTGRLSVMNRVRVSAVFFVLGAIMFEML